MCMDRLIDDPGEVVGLPLWSYYNATNHTQPLFNSSRVVSVGDQSVGNDRECLVAYLISQSNIRLLVVLVRTC